LDDFELLAAILLGTASSGLSERGLFFQTPDGHLFELMASSSDRP
jgi:hypothetical protein